MTGTDPLGRLGADLSAAARDFEDIDLTPANEELAAAVRDEAPYVTGYLAGSVFADREGVGVSAVYAGVVHDSNPYAERAVDRVDVAGLAQQLVDEVLDQHVQSIYV